MYALKEIVEKIVQIRSANRKPTCPRIIADPDDMDKPHDFWECQREAREFVLEQWRRLRDLRFMFVLKPLGRYGDSVEDILRFMKGDWGKLRKDTGIVLSNACLNYIAYVLPRVAAPDP